MLYDPRGFSRLRNRILFVSGCAWVCLLAGSLYAGVQSSAAAESHSSHGLSPSVVHIPELASFVFGWFLMLVAMMAPTLIAPLEYIRERSFKRRRLRSSALFVFGYAAVWMIVAALFYAADDVLKISQSQSFWPAAGFAMLALGWQISPVKQRCLNRCQKHGSFAAFGAAADIDSLRFGISHGVWCAGSCWALMLFPMLLPQGHLAGMAAASVLILSERLEKPARPSWRFRGLGKATRIVVAQTRAYLR